MANCTACGAELKDGVRFCPECGSSVEKKAAPERKQSIYQQPAGVQAASPQPQMQYQTSQQPVQAVPSGKYELISTGGIDCFG